MHVEQCKGPEAGAWRYEEKDDDGPSIRKFRPPDCWSN